MRLNGLPIYFNANCLEQTNEPRRVHHERRWSRGTAYHRRIQKKWIKRFGFVMQPCMFKTPMAIFAHPAFEPEIRRALQITHDEQRRHA